MVSVWIDPIESLSGSDPGDVPIKLFRYFFRGRVGGTSGRWLDLVVVRFEVWFASTMSLGWLIISQARWIEGWFYVVWVGNWIGLGWLV